jgi:hypothetical protein
MIIAAMLPQNRESATAQASQPRNCHGLFSAVGLAQGQRPSLVSIAKQIAVDNSMGESTVWNWYRRYQQGGYEALGRKRRADRGRAIFLDRYPELLPMIDVRLSAGLSPKAVWKSLLWIRGLHGPSYDVVLRYARGGYRFDGESPAHAGSAATL